MHRVTPRRAGLSRSVLGIILAFALSDAPAQALPGADLASVRQWALAHNPSLAAGVLDAEAAQQRIVPAGALPDPMVGITLRDIDPQAPWRSPGTTTGNLLQLRQTVPLWGKRDLARQAATAEADAAGAEQQALTRRVLADVETAYARYWEAGEALRVIDRRIALIEQVEEIAGVRYAVGLAPQQDAIRAQVMRTQFAAERLEREAMQQEAAAMLNAALGRPADAPLAPPAAAPELAVRWTTLAEARVALRPELQPELGARAAMTRAADRTSELQRRQRRPDVTFGVGAMQRGNGVESLELMVEMQIPLQRRALHAREREAELRAEAARVREGATRTELEGRLAGALAQWRTARERRRLADTTLRVQSDANFKSALASYQTGEVDFATVLDALDAWQGADLIRLAAQRDELIAAAAVRAVEGAQP